MRGYSLVQAYLKLPVLNKTASCRSRLLAVGAAAAVALSATTAGHAASFQSDANGFVVMETENFDLNYALANGQWGFDNTPLSFDTDFSGWGYMKALYSGGTNLNLSPRMGFTVNFTAAGTYYIWVCGSDDGGATLDVGLDGVVPASASDIGTSAGTGFGPRHGGEWWWLSDYNDGSGYDLGHRPYLTIPSPGVYTVNVFIRDAGLDLDRICLTTNIDFAPSPLYDGANSAGVPAQTLAPAPDLAVAITQPANGQTLYGGPSNTVPIVAKPATNGTSVNKIEFYSKLVSAGSYAKTGEAASQPYMMMWSNPPAGSNLLMAVVTDSSAQHATSAVVNVHITLPPPLTPLKWETNNFDSGLGTWTLQSQNHEGGFDFGWQNSTNAGGPAGEMGGHFVRRSDISPYVAEPLSRPVSLNEDLWIVGSMMFSNVDMNADTFLGYLDTNSGARFGLKIREPNNGYWRFNTGPINANTKINNTLADKAVAQFVLHWIPSGDGDGSGSVTGMLAGAAITATVPLTFPASGETYNAFGRFVPTQGSTDTNRHSFQYFDSLAYVVPAMPVLDIQRVPVNQVVLSWDAGLSGYVLQYNDNSITNTSWTDSADAVYQVGSMKYVTNAINASPRWYRLRHP